MFDDQTKKWSVEWESEYLDGNIWDEEGKNWFWSDEDNTYPEFVIDERCRNMLNALVTIWPAVDTEV
jgi:hypothetical protein